MKIGDEVEAFDDIELGQEIKEAFKNKYIHFRANIRMWIGRLNDEKYTNDYSEIQDKLNILLQKNEDLISDFCNKLFPIHSKDRYILSHDLNYIKNEKRTELISLFDRGLLAGYRIIEGSTKLESVIGFKVDDFKKGKFQLAKKVKLPCNDIHDVYFRAKDLQLCGFIKSDTKDKPVIDADFIKSVKLDVEAIVKATTANFKAAREAKTSRATADHIAAAHAAAKAYIGESPASKIHAECISVKIFENPPQAQHHRTLRNRLYKAIAEQMGYKIPTDSQLQKLLSAEKTTY